MKQPANQKRDIHKRAVTDSTVDYYCTCLSGLLQKGSGFLTDETKRCGGSGPPFVLLPLLLSSITQSIKSSTVASLFLGINFTNLFSMQFCLSISRQGQVVSRHSRALASSASSAAAPTSPPPAVSPSVPVDPKFNRNKDDKKLLNHSGKESIVSSVLGLASQKNPSALTRVM